MPAPISTARRLPGFCTAFVVVAGLLLVACADLPRNVPPPWASDAAPVIHTQATPAAVQPLPPSEIVEIRPKGSAPAPVLMPPARAPVAEPNMPMGPIFYAPTTAAAPFAPVASLDDPRRVLQASPGPALALDFTPNAAWKRAVIPPNSKPAAVGKVSAPANAGFVIGPGDTVAINVLGRSELTASANVGADGMVTAALLGPIKIAGLSPAQAGEKIAKAYKDQQYLVSPQVAVTLSEYQSQQLTVIGEVRNPGRYPMRTQLSVLDGLALAGGVSEQGGSMAYILRPEDSVVTRYEVDLDGLIQAGAGQQYFELLPGDSVVVPKTAVFYIYGEVKTPNAYRLKPGITVIQALSLAGGLTDKGSDRRIDIRRAQANGRLQTQSASLNDRLQADDVIYVRERLF